MAWLDPEPPHAEHSAFECQKALPKIRDIDIERRFECDVCHRVWRAKYGDQREPDPYWTEERVR